MKKLRFFVIVFLFLCFCFLVSVNPTLAVTKSSGNLEITSDDPLFPGSTVWYPGLQQTSSLTVTNLGSIAYDLYVGAINVFQDDGIADAFLVEFTSGGESLYGDSDSKSLVDFFDADDIELLNIEVDGSVVIEVTISMLVLTENEHQNEEMGFDLEIGFVGEEEEEEEEESVIVISGIDDSNSSSNSDPETGSFGLPGPPVCNDISPGGAPILLSGVAGINSVVLSWQSALDPVSYYLVAYGTVPGDYSYGNPHIGGKGATSYTATGLSGGETYYFAVRAGNGCAPGEFSNELSVAPSGEFLTGTAVNFFPEVMGESSPAGKLKEGDFAAINQVMGEESREIFDWRWLILVLGIIFPVGLYLYLKKK